MKNHFLPFILCVLLIACNTPSDQSGLNQSEEDSKEVVKLSASDNNAIIPNDAKDILVHFVFLNLKDDVNAKEIIDEIWKLKNIETVHNLEVGTFQDLKDKRAMSDFDLFFQMDFRTEEDYRKYQKHPIHLGMKENLGSALASPPVSYDYLTK